MNGSSETPIASPSRE